MTITGLAEGTRWLFTWTWWRGAQPHLRRIKRKKQRDPAVRETIQERRKRPMAWPNDGLFDLYRWRFAYARVKRKKGRYITAEQHRAETSLRQLVARPICYSYKPTRKQRFFCSFFHFSVFWVCASLFLFTRNCRSSLLSLTTLRRATI